ncbi:MAG: hypothetical protein ACRDPG_05890 [Nocardioidaceae bacterium]
MGLAIIVSLVMPVFLGVSVAQAVTTDAITNTPDQTAWFNGVVRVVVYDGGTIYVGGDFTAAVQNGNTITRNHVAAIDAATGSVLPWNPNTNGNVLAITYTPSGVYLGGVFGTVGGARHTRIARVSLASGAVDSTFQHSANRAVRALTSDGSTVYAGGNFTSIDGASRAQLAAFNDASGSLSSTWLPVANGIVRALDASNGVVYVGGEFSTMDGLSRGRYLAAVNPTTGALQPGFNSPLGYRVMAVAATTSQIYAAADGPGGNLLATSLDGTLQWLLTTDGGFQAVTVLGDTVYAGGHFGNACTTSRTGLHGTCLDGKVSRKKLLAVSSSGQLLPWAPQANSSLGAHSLSANPQTGQIAAGGEWTTLNSGKIYQPYFALFG